MAPLIRPASTRIRSANAALPPSCAMPARPASCSMRSDRGAPVSVAATAARRSSVWKLRQSMTDGFSWVHVAAFAPSVPGPRSMESSLVQSPATMLLLPTKRSDHHALLLQDAAHAAEAPDRDHLGGLEPDAVLGLGGHHQLDVAQAVPAAHARRASVVREHADRLAQGACEEFLELHDESRCVMWWVARS